MECDPDKETIEWINESFNSLNGSMECDSITWTDEYYIHSFNSLNGSMECDSPLNYGSWFSRLQA